VELPFNWEKRRGDNNNTPPSTVCWTKPGCSTAPNAETGSDVTEYRVECWSVMANTPWQSPVVTDTG
jgi:hypothetical protein